MIKFEIDQITHAVNCMVEGTTPDLVLETAAMLHTLESDPRFLELVELSKQFKEQESVEFETYDRLSKKWTERRKS